MEAQFVIAGVIADEMKYCYVLQCLDEHALAEVSDVVSSEDRQDGYRRLKERLISVFEESEERQLRRLLDETEPTYDKPSQLLCRMRELAKDKVAETVLRLFSLQRLSSQTQAIFVGSKQSLEELAVFADRIADVTTFSSSNVTAVAADTPGTQQLLTAILDRLGRLEKGHSQRDGKKPRGAPSPQRNRSRSRKGVCWYHSRFKAEARKCTAPCTCQRNRAPKN